MDFTEEMDQSEALEWSQSDCLSLVLEYERRPLLWRKRHPMHRVPSAKHKAWADIARVLECSTVDVRRKMNSLLASFRRVRAKVSTTGRTPWYLYPHMRFLPGYVEAREQDAQDQEAETEEYVDVKIQDQSNDVQSDDTHVSDDNDVIKNEPPARVEQYEYHPDDRAHRKQKHGKRRLTRTIQMKRHNTTVPESYSKAYVDRKLLEIQRMVKLEANAGRKDDCDSYGEYIASTLRKYDSKAQCMIKQAINTLLYEQEMTRFENPLELEMAVEHLDPSDDDDN